MKTSFIIILGLFFLGCNQNKVLDGEIILKKAIIKHDSLNSWDKTKFEIHIQEPRIANPKRFSILKLDNSINTFELSRNRDQHMSKHIIDSSGKSFVLLDGKEEIDSVLIKKYRLSSSRNIGYKNFYKLMYGLPMSLNHSLGKIIHASEKTFKSEECYKIEMELKESIISKYWNLYISKSSMMAIGIEIIFPNDSNKGERLYFDELIIVNGIKIPRIRHWHELKDDTYSGSDLIIKELENSQ